MFSQVFLPGAVIALMISFLLGSSALAAGDAQRGKLIYETRCGACHESSVHNRNARKAKSFTSLRAQVQRWSGEVGGSWNAGEIDDITLYLNQRFYHFPCPLSVCKAAQAAIAR